MEWPIATYIDTCNFNFSDPQCNWIGSLYKSDVYEVVLYIASDEQSDEDQIVWNIQAAQSWSSQFQIHIPDNYMDKTFMYLQ